MLVSWACRDQATFGQIVEIYINSGSFARRSGIEMNVGRYIKRYGKRHYDAAGKPYWVINPELKDIIIKEAK
jgi:hypothetical protein